MTLSNKAIRTGTIYCAPSCGFKCKWAAYEQAVIDASELAKSLGDDWEPRVWENLGWHYSVETRDRRVNLHPGGVDVKTGKVGRYTAFLSPEPSSGGRWAESGDTPQEALEAVRAKAQEELDGVKLAMEAIAQVA
jgi:hypothetical protein